MMDLRRVRVFCAVAEHQSFSGAADALGYTQPSVSHHIASLERELGHQLIVRGRRGGRTFALTRAGELLQRSAVPALEELARAELALESLSRGESGNIVLGAVVSGLRSVVPIALSAFSERYPAVEIVIEQLAPSQILDGLRAGDVDVGVLFHSSPEAPELDAFRCQLLFEQSLIAALPASHRHARRQRVNLRQLERERWLLPDARRFPDFRRETDELLGRAEVCPSATMEIGDDFAAAKLIAAGTGVAITPAMSALPVAGIAYVPVDPPATRALYAVAQRGASTPAKRALLDDLRRAASRFQPGAPG